MVSILHSNPLLKMAFNIARSASFPAFFVILLCKHIKIENYIPKNRLQLLFDSTCTMVIIHLADEHPVVYSVPSDVRDTETDRVSHAFLPTPLGWNWYMTRFIVCSANADLQRLYQDSRASVETYYTDSHVYCTITTTQFIYSTQKLATLLSILCVLLMYIFILYAMFHS